MMEVAQREVPANIRALEKFLGTQLGDTRLSQQQRLYLLDLVQSPGWSVLLDMMQQQCILQDSRLVNVPAEDEKKVLAEHKLAKAMWLFFLRLQKKVQFEINESYADGETRLPAQDTEF